eukprot:COSAG02_NODE_7661_length_2906_cov_4.665954_2_plen_243_part_00
MRAKLRRGRVSPPRDCAVRWRGRRPCGRASRWRAGNAWPASRFCGYLATRCASSSASSPPGLRLAALPPPPPPPPPVLLPPVVLVATASVHRVSSHVRAGACRWLGPCVGAAQTMSGTGACSLAGAFFKKFIPGLDTICASLRPRLVAPLAQPGRWSRDLLTPPRGVTCVRCLPARNLPGQTCRTRPGAITTTSSAKWCVASACGLAPERTHRLALPKVLWLCAECLPRPRLPHICRESFLD